MPATGRDEALVAVVSPSDPLATRSTITVRELRHRPLISLPHGSGLRTALDDACATLGFNPRVAFEASAPGIVAQLAGRGLGMAIVPESVANAHHHEVHALAITRPRLRARIALAWRAKESTRPGARALIEHARSVLTTSSSDGQPAA